MDNAGQMEPAALPGTMKVAILLQSLGESTANRILSRMDREEREAVRAQMAQVANVPAAVVEKVAREFTELFEKRPRFAQGPAKGLPGSAEERGEKEGGEGESPSLQTLRSLDAEELLELVKGEHPQTIALILVHIGPDVASEVLSRLEDEIKIDVSLRIARLDRVIAGMINEIDKVFEDFLKTRQTATAQKTDGVDRLAEILNLTDEMSGELILGEIEDRDPELAARIQQKMFVFEDLLLVDDRGLQKVLRKVETKELSIALKGASEDVRGKIFRNMSSRAAEMLQEEIEAVGAVRMKEVEDAQHAITKVIQDLEKKGELIVSGRRGGDLIS
jgi:flagellar motor switch protein FliG